MAEKSIYWVTNGTGDGTSGGYTMADLVTWLRRTFVSDNPATQGVLPGYNNELAVTGTASPVSIATGGAVVYGYPYENDSATTVAIPTPAGSTRIDRIVLRASWAAQTVRITRIAGTEGAGAPAITQTPGTTYDLKLAQVSITTGGVITVTDERAFCHFATRVATENIDDGAITAPKIVGGAVGEAMLATGAVTETKIATGAVTETKIGGGAVTGTKIGALAVAAAALAGDAVETAKIKDLAVTVGKLAGSITYDKITNVPVHDHTGDAGDGGSLNLSQWAKGNNLRVDGGRRTFSLADHLTDSTQAVTFTTAFSAAPFIGFRRRGGTEGAGPPVWVDAESTTGFTMHVRTEGWGAWNGTVDWWATGSV